MKLSANQFVSNALKNLKLPMKYKLDEKSETINSEAQRHIKEMQRMVAEEARAQKRMEADQIAKKIARGENVTNEEREQVRGVNAEMLRKAEQANLQRKELKARLANATTKEQANTILLEGKMSAGATIEKGDEQYGTLLLEAVNQAEAEYNGRKQTQPDTGSKRSIEIQKRAHLFDVRL